MQDASASPLWDWQYPSRAVEAFVGEPLRFCDIPGWEIDDHVAALECFAKSHPLASLHSAATARAFFESSFSPVRMTSGPGLLTSYFEPVLNGSRTPSSRFYVPLYRRPRDLLAVPLDHPLRTKDLTAARQLADGLVPYFTRQEIETGVLEGQGLELLYVDDEVAAFVMHVQGSGAIQLEDGTVMRLAFDGKNGHPYTSVGKRLVTLGELTVEAASLDAVVDWLRASTERGRRLMWENKSYIFFRELDASAVGPVGSAGVALTAGRSLAVDARIHPLGAPVFVSAPSLVYEGVPFQRLMIAQDTGSAIVGPSRGDLFAGSGERAGAVAGRVRHPCEFFMLKPI